MTDLTPYRRSKCSLVKPERKRPLPPARVAAKKVGCVCKTTAPRSQPSLERTCDNLILHRPSAQPNCLRCATQVGGVTSYCGLCFRLGRVGGCPFAVGICASE
jgi:hypothetical protein